MRISALFVCLSAALFLGACASQPEPAAPAPVDSSTPAESATPVSAESLSGVWSGDWGPSERDRNDVTLELRSEGAALKGTINPGPDAIPLSEAMFHADSQEIMLKAETKDRRGDVLHYTIEGKVEGDTMKGTWMHERGNGDFQVTRK